ncbi:hypothetical protein [Ehrlichia japonica]|uniref:hypothetical protein n=1 Tax=Ehrlichia japonica TaxID=391036 RepID=UPI000AD4ED42|nr:hypothetical protein [Ehrlichia japonica]
MCYNKEETRIRSGPVSGNLIALSNRSSRRSHEKLRDTKKDPLFNVSKSCIQTEKFLVL